MSMEHSLIPLDDLCGFASRRNLKRGFLFVSKVLGKHIPVRPSEMRKIYDLLADQLLDLPQPVAMIGLAETATALAHGVYESWWRKTGADSVYLQSTRYHANRPPALGFDEQHSHATSHLLYAPEDARLKERFEQAASIVIIDDELSTGNTLGNLLAAYQAMNKSVSDVRIASITDWLGAGRRAELAAQVQPTRLEFANIAQGQFTFEADPEFDCKANVNVTGNNGRKDQYLSRNYGRFGVSGLLDIDMPRLLEGANLQPGQRVLALGTGEFMYPPFLVAEWLEAEGFDVRFQSTTRSPILCGDAVKSAIETRDNYWDDIPNYLYNMEPDAYDKVLIGYETHPLPPYHDLPQRLGATILNF